MTDRCQLGFLAEAPAFSWPAGDLIYLFDAVDNIKKIARIKADLSSVVSVNTVAGLPNNFDPSRGFLDGNIYFVPPTLGTQYMGVNVDNGSYAGTKTMPLLTSIAKSLLDTKEYVYYPSSTGNKIVKYHKDTGTYVAATISGSLTIVDDYGLFWDDTKESFLISDNTPTTHVMRIVDPDTGFVGFYYGGVQASLPGATIDAYRGYLIAHSSGGFFGASSNGVGMSVFSLGTPNTTNGVVNRAYKTHAQIATAIGTTYYMESNYLASNGTVFAQGNRDVAYGGGPSLFLLDKNIDVVATRADIGGWIPVGGASAAFMWE